MWRQGFRLQQGRCCLDDDLNGVRAADDRAGLALFYAGMARSKNALSTAMQSFSIFCVIAVLWVVYGYSVAFTAGNPYWGSWDKLFMLGEDPATAVAATFSKGQYLPDFVYCMFQLTFAAITVALICGGFAERFKFSAMILFAILWFTFAYLPVAHMVWYWDGPDAYTTAKLAEEANSHAGYIFQKGALDFAGGTVVHVNSGIAALVCALMLGKRNGYGKVAMPPHSVMMTAIGTGMLWMGWFGFNAGSALEANGGAGIAFFNTLFGTATAGVAWALIEWLVKGKPSLLASARGSSRVWWQSRQQPVMSDRWSVCYLRCRRRALLLRRDESQGMAGLRRLARYLRCALHRWNHRLARHRYLCQSQVRRHWSLRLRRQQGG